MREARRIRQIRDKAYTGIRGAQRKNFCLAYRATLTRIRAKTDAEFASKLALKKETVSCSKGCSVCCSQHITVPVAHAIAVIDFLYSREPGLARFLENYRPWHERAGNLCDEIDAAYNAAIDPSLESSSGEFGKALSRKYFSQKIPCPFLVKSACSIYEVRPICCAAHLSVGPREWCDPADTHDLRTFDAIPSSEDLQELVKLAPLQLSIYHITLPTMVYQLLTQELSDILTEIDRQIPGPGDPRSG